MAKEILVSIKVDSGAAKPALDNIDKGAKNVKKSTDSLNKSNADLTKGYFKLDEATRRLLADERKRSIQLANTRRLIDLQARAELGDVQAKELLIRATQEQTQAQNAANAANTQYRATSGLTNAIILETGRLASDASFGFTAIANNLSQVLFLFQSLVANERKEGKGVGAAFRRVGKSIFGGGGILIGIQLLISFGPKLLKMLQGSGAAARKLANDLREAGNELKGTIANINGLVTVLETQNLNYQDSVDVLDKLKKITGENNLELDAANQLTEESNRLVQNRIKIMIAEAKIDAAKQAINEQTKKALNEIAALRENENSAFNKFITLAQTIIQPAIDAIGRTIDRITGFIRNALEVARQIPVVGGGIAKLLGILEAPFKLGEAAVKAYTDAVNSQEQQDKRAAKTKEKIQKIQNKLNKENQDAIGVIVEQETIIAKLTTTQKKNNDELERKKELMKEQLRIQDELFKAELENIEKVGKIREKFNKASLDFDDRKRGNTQTQINIEEQRALTELNNIDTVADKELARQAIRDYYGRLRVEREKEEDRIILDSKLMMYSEIANAAGALSELFKEGTALQKTLALTEIAASAAVSYIESVRFAQEVALDPSVPAVAKPFVFAATKLSQVATIANAIARAKSILQGGAVGGGGGDSAPVNISAPAFNVVGASPLDLLMVDVSNKLEKPIPAYITAKGAIETLDEYYRNVRTGSNT